MDKTKVLWVLVLVSLALNVYLFYDMYQTKSELEVTQYYLRDSIQKFCWKTEGHFLGNIATDNECCVWSEGTAEEQKVCLIIGPGAMEKRLKINQQMLEEITNK